MSAIGVDPNVLPNGTVLERYRIERVLGRGGFAITYLAQHRDLGHAVALKEYFPRGEGRRDDGLRVVSISDVFADGRTQFLAEGRKLATLRQTPNVVHVIDLFEALGTAYLVMEYEEGETLEALIQRGQRPDEAFVRKIASRLLAVLTTLHHKPKPDIVHRDISPSNIMLRRDGEPVLIDFGSARSELARLARDVTRVVKDGYSPPEQYGNTASEQGPWSDLYALGATLHHLVTGQLPACATDRTQALLRRRPDPHTPAAVAAAGRYSEALLRWIDRLTAIHSDERPASAMLAKQMLEGSQPPAAAGAAASGPTKPLDPKYRFDASPGSKAHKAAPTPAPAERTGPAAFGIGWWSLWTLLLLGMAGAFVWWQQQGHAPPWAPAKATRPQSISDAPPEPLIIAPTTGTLVVSTDADCTLTIDGKTKGKLWAGATQSAELSIGEHLLACHSTARTEIAEQQSKAIKAGQQSAHAFELSARVAAAQKAEDDKQAEQRRLAEEEQRRASAPRTFSDSDLNKEPCLTARIFYFEPVPETPGPWTADQEATVREAASKISFADGARDVLACHAAYLVSRPNARVTIEGHTDEIGSRDDNLAIAEYRASAVRDMLLSAGAAADQVSIVSYGEERPICTESDEHCYGLNRRAELVYTSTR